MPGTAGNFGGFYTPYYGSTDTGAASQAFSTGASVGGGAGMSSAMGGALTSAAGSLISGYFSSQSEARQQAASAKMQKDNLLSDAYRQDKAYKRALEERLQREKDMEQYSAFYRGNAPLMAAPNTDPSTVNPVDPYAAKPKK